MATQQDVAEKVALLLAKAEGTDNPHEAEAYTTKAEELMLKYSIEEAEIQAKRPGVRVDAIVMEKIQVSGQYANGFLVFGTVVSEAFSLKAYQQKAAAPGHAGRPDQMSYIWLVGHQSDVDQATTLIRSLLIQSVSAQEHWWHTEGRALTKNLKPSAKYNTKLEFYFSFASGARERLSETRNRVVKESGTGTDLVLADRAKLVEDWASQNVASSRARNRIARGDYSAHVAGHQAGREAVGQGRIR